MKPIIVSREISAPKALVFQTVANIREFAKACPKIVKYEFLTEIESGVGTKFRETRMMGGKEAVTDLEVTEYEENDHIRLVADSHGAVWDSVFRVRETEGITTLTLTMEARSYRLLAKVMNFLFQGMIKKEVAKDMDRVKAYCEKVEA